MIEFTNRYHFWNGVKDKTVDSNYCAIAPSTIKFNDDLFDVQSKLIEMKEDGNVVCHINCFPETTDKP
jgi:hypothetical protein